MEMASGEVLLRWGEFRNFTTVKGIKELSTATEN